MRARLVGRPSPGGAPGAHLGSAVGMVLAALCVAIGARLEVPMAPVPMTLQSFAVVVAGGLLGPRAGALSMLLYLAAGALGAPVFAGGSSGPAALTGPTAGYLWSFPLACALAALGRPTSSWRDVARRTTLYALAHALILALGVLWLARSLGIALAAAEGAWPFLPGMLVKSFAAAWLVGRVRDRQARTVRAIEPSARRRQR